MSDIIETYPTPRDDQSSAIRSLLAAESSVRRKKKKYRLSRNGEKFAKTVPGCWFRNGALLNNRNFSARGVLRALRNTLRQTVGM